MVANPVYRHLLIATDGSELASKGVREGLSLALDLGASVTFLNVTEPFPAFGLGDPMANYAAGDSFNDYREEGARVAAKILGKCRSAAEEVGVEADTFHAEIVRPAEAIIETAKERGCDLIVMASHGRRGLGRLFLGSQTIEVLSYSTIPVLVVR